MTIEEAIPILKKHKDTDLKIEEMEAINIAIKALNSLSTIGLYTYCMTKLLIAIQTEAESNDN